MKIKKIILIIAVINFNFCGYGYPQDKKEELRQYMSKVGPILTNVQMTSRNMSQKFITLEIAVRQMKESAGQLKEINPPSFMARQHKMILLSLLKMRKGFYLLSRGDRIASIPLARNGAELLRTAVGDMMSLAREEGLIKERGIK